MEKRSDELKKKLETAEYRHVGKQHYFIITGKKTYGAKKYYTQSLFYLNIILSYYAYPLYSLNILLKIQLYYMVTSGPSKKKDSDVVFITMKSGSTYEGQVNDLNERHGYGVYSVVCAGRYEGQWMKGFKHGNGQFYAKDGHLGYDGEWECGEPHGYGKCYNSAGELTYEGEFIKGFKKGNKKVSYRDLMK